MARKAPLRPGGNATGLAFNSAGNLFESDFSGGHIYEYSPNGGQSTFASGGALWLAFQGMALPVPEPSVAALLAIAAAVLLVRRRHRAARC